MLAVEVSISWPIVLLPNPCCLCRFVVQRSGDALPSQECYEFVTKARYNGAVSQSEEAEPYTGEPGDDVIFGDLKDPERLGNTQGNVFLNLFGQHAFCLYRLPILSCSALVQHPA